MFTNLRKSAQGFFAKLILFFLTGMFVLWGIGDVFRGMGGPVTDIATVGKQTITVQQVRESMRRSNASSQDAIGGLVNDALVSQEAKAMGIEVNDDTVAHFIVTLPQFQDSGGRFDKALYQRMLANGNTDEARFVENIRHEIGARMLINSFTDAIQAPEKLVQSLYRLQEEQRTADLLLIPASAIASHIPVPDAQTIKTYYETHSKKFMAPEYRTLTYVALPLADVQSKINVPEEDVKRAYEDRIQEFHHPELRQIDQMIFASEADAKKAAAKLNTGGSFDAVAKSSNLLNKGMLSLGELAQQDLPPEGEKAGLFKLKEGAVSMPVQSDFGWHIFRIRKIIPEGTFSMSQGHAELVKDIASRQAQEAAVKLINGFEDALAGGEPLERAADTIGQKIHVTGPVNHEGNGPDGKKADVPPYPPFLNVAFATPEKDHSQAVQAADGSYFMVRVDSIAPEHVRPLAEVKDAVAQAMLAEKTQAQLEKLVETISEQAHAGKSPETLLAENGLDIKPVASGPLKRSTDAVPEGALKNRQLPRALVSELFRLRLHESTLAYPERDGSYIIASLTQVTPAPQPPDPKIVSDLRATVVGTLADETIHAYLNYLRGKYPVAYKASPSILKHETEGE